MASVSQSVSQSVNLKSAVCSFVQPGSAPAQSVGCRRRAHDEEGVGRPATLIGLVNKCVSKLGAGTVHIQSG